MKAAVLKQLGILPIFTDFPEPVAISDEQILITVKAAALKNRERGQGEGCLF